MVGRDFLSIAFFVLATSLLLMDNASAYIDPGTGSMILQALMAGALAILAFWKRIHAYLQRVFQKKNDDVADLKNDSGDEA